MAPSKNSNMGQVIEYIPGMKLPPTASLRPAMGWLRNTMSHCYPMFGGYRRLNGVLGGDLDDCCPAFLGSLLSPAVPEVPMTLLTITDRLYLAAYINPPNADTLFPYPATPVRTSPSKRSQRVVDGPQVAPSVPEKQRPYYFSVDDTLLYNAFHHDFGPLHMGHLYRFAILFHDILGAKENKERPIVFWSRADPRSM